MTDPKAPKRSWRVVMPDASIGATLEPPAFGTTPIAAEPLLPTPVVESLPPTPAAVFPPTPVAVALPPTPVAVALPPQPVAVAPPPPRAPVVAPTLAAPRAARVKWHGDGATPIRPFPGVHSIHAPWMPPRKPHPVIK